MLEIRKQLEETVPFIKSKTTIEPKIAIILGTGMGKIAEIIEADAVIPYGEIPHFPVSSAPSHEGNLIFGHLEGAPVMMMQGRVHFYEGYSMKEITYPVRLMKALGVDTLIGCNAVGALNPLFRKGDIMMITDLINLMGDNPLRGENDDELGVRFPDMTRAFTPELRDVVEKVALDNGIRLMQGVFVGLMGPNLETPAEYRFLRQIGADAVGMSTVPEVIVAVHGDMRVLCFSMMTDMCLPDALEPVSIEDVVAAANEAGAKLADLICKAIPSVMATM